VTYHTRLGNTVWTAVVAILFLISFAGVASAGGWNWGGDGGGYCAPELDPGSSAGGLALLVGGCLIALERFRRR
jgi:hypothetical protein